MPDFSLDDLDPGVREQAEAQAAALGVSVDDYLAETLLKSLLMDEAEADPPTAAPTAGGREARAVNERLDAIDRRLGLAFGGFDAGFEGLRGSIGALAARIDDGEAREQDQAERIGGALETLRASIDALDLRLDEADIRAEAIEHAQNVARDDLAGRADAALTALRHAIDAMGAELRLAQDEAHAELRSDIGAMALATAQRFDRLEQGVRGADALALGAHQALETLSARLEDDIAAAATETGRRIAIQDDLMRFALQKVAEGAESETAALREAMERDRDALEKQISEGVAAVHARVDRSLTHSTKLYEAIAERLGESERAAADAADAAREHAAAREAAIRDALMELSRATSAALAAQVEEAERFAEGQRGAMQTFEATLTDELRELAERQQDNVARLKSTDQAIAEVAIDVAQLRAALNRNTEGVAARLEALSQGQLAASAETDALRRELAESEARREAGFGALKREVQTATEGLQDELIDLAGRFSDETADGRTQHRGVAARLKVVEERLATPDAEVEALAERIAACELSAREAAERSVQLAEQVAALSRQHGEAMQALDRLHVVEMTLSDLRLERVSAARAGESVERKLAELQQSQSQAALTLRRELAHLVEQAMGQNAAQDTAALQALRDSVDERIAAVERRSVAALEQLSEIVTLLGKRKAAPDLPQAQSA